MFRRLIVVCATTSLSLTGCGSTPPVKSPALLDSIKLLELAADKREDVDPKTLLEVKLGDFKVTHASNVPEQLVNIKFTLYGVLPDSKKDAFEASLKKNQQRLRDAVLSFVHRADFEIITDPTLVGLKSELLVPINQTLETNVVRDIVFSSYSVERG